jgi:hypothetical protein
MPPVPPTVADTSGPPNPETAYVREQVRNESDDGSLSSFIRRLSHGEPPAPPPNPVDHSGSTRGTAAQAQAQPVAQKGAEPAKEKPAKEKKEPPPPPPALDRFVSYLGGLLGVDLFKPGPPRAAGAADGHAVPPAKAAPRALTPEVATPAPATTAGVAPSPATPAAATTASVAPSAATPASATTASVAKEPARLPLSVIAGEQAAGQVRFTSGLAVPAGATEQLRTIVDQARVMGLGLRVVGHASDPAGSLDRARAVAAALVSLGAPADRLDIEAGGPGEATLVYLSPRGTS